jgi:hypothetical protein
MSNILTVEPAFAGHAGDVGSPLMPHELMSGIVLVIVLILFLGALTAVMLKRLNRLERRLRSLEDRLRSLPGSASPHD